MKIFSIILAVSFLLAPCLIVAQESSSVNTTEYWEAIQAKEYDKAINLVEELIKAFTSSFQWDSTLVYNEQLAQLGVLTNNLKLEIKGKQGFVSIKRFFGDDSPEIQAKERAIFSLLDTTRLEAEFVCQLYQNYSLFFQKTQQLDSAIIYGEKAIYFADKSKDPKKMTLTRIAQAQDLKIDGQYGAAIVYLTAAEKIVSTTYIEEIVRIRLYQEMAGLLISINDYANAHAYLNLANELSTNKGYHSFIKDAAMIRSRIYTKEKKYDQALPLALSAYSYYKEKQIGVRVKIILKELCYIYAGKKDYINFRKKIKELEASGDDYFGELQLLKLSVALEKEELTEAKILIDSLSARNRLIPRYQKTLYKNSSRYFQSVGDSKRALDNYKLYILKRDSIDSVKQIALTRRLEAEFNRKQKDAEIKSLNLASQAQEKALAIRNTALVLGSLMLAILGSLLFGLYRLYNKNQESQLKLAAQNIQISEALAQNQMLIKEIHHRVKNNLQVISSLLSMQERKVTDAGTRTALRSSKNRVQSMSILHQKLYQGENLKKVNVQEYISELVENIKDSYSLDFNLRIETKIDPLELDVEVLIPIGLIVTELVSNSIKHAFVGKESGYISILLKGSKENYLLQVKDNGIGLPSNVLPNKDGALGTRLIHSFTRGLDGTLEVDNQNGTMVEIKFQSMEL